MEDEESDDNSRRLDADLSSDEEEEERGSQGSSEEMSDSSDSEDESEEFESSVELLRQNLPGSARANISLYAENDAEIAEALEHNTVITEIVLNMRRMEDVPTEWQHLCRVLATRPNLYEITLHDSFYSELRSPVDQIRTFLQAIQLNSAIRSVSLVYLNLSGEAAASLLDAARFITSFRIFYCAFEPVARSLQDSGIQTVAAALQRNVQIQELGLCGEHFILLPILQGLVANKTLQKFSIAWSWLTDNPNTAETSHAIQHLLESTTSIQHFSLRGKFTQRTFRPIAQGLASSRTVIEMSFEGCSFTDSDSMSLFSNLIQSKRALRSLTLSMGIFSFRALEYPLKSFHALMEAVKRSKLEDFTLTFSEEAVSTSHVRILAESIPDMKIRKLKTRIQVEDDAMLLEGLKRNFSIHSWDIAGLDHRLNSRLQFYLDRNRRLAQWVDNPACVSRHLWPLAMHLAMQAGENTLYRSLQAVLGNEIESARGKRKRQDGDGDETT